MTSAANTKATGSTTSSASSTGGKEVAVGAGSSTELVNEHGRTSIADTVVAKIAGIATREIDGVHDLGGSASRMVGRVRDVIPGTGQSVTQGVAVEVGEKQAAVDIGLVAEYGVAIHELAAAIRSHVMSAISDMTGLEVTEVNITVYDIHLSDDTDDTEPTEPRVQ